MRALFRFVEFEARAAGDDFFLMRQIILQNFAQIQRFRLGAVFHKRQHNQAVRNLQIRLFIQRVQNHLRVRVFLHFDHDAHTRSVRFFADIGNAFQSLVAHHIRNRLD